MEDILKFCENLPNISAQVKTSFSLKLLNDIPSLQTFLNEIFLIENNAFPNNLFLCFLNFATEYMSIPFILYLNCFEFCNIIQIKMQSLKKEEKIWLKEIFENMFEKFLDYETKQSNLEIIELIVSLYMQIFDESLDEFIKKQFNKKGKNSQNNFEKVYNSTKIILKETIAFVQAEEFLHDFNSVFRNLKNIDINLKICKSSSEEMLIKLLIDEKETLINILESVCEEHGSLQEEEKKDENKKEIIFINDDDDKIIKKSKKKEKNKDIQKHQIQSQDKKLEECTSLLYRSHVMFPEDIETEYKNYIFPLSEEKKTILRRTICGFLNTNGGRIYIGIRDSDQCVIGLDLTTKDQDNVVLVIDDLLKEITPLVTPDECVTKFIPVKFEENKYIPGCFLVKIIVKRGKINDLYFTTNNFSYFSYERRNGKNQILEPSELKKKIIERSKFAESDNKMNIEYNKKFLDKEPEKGIPKFMKIENNSKNKFNQFVKEQNEKKKSKDKNKQIIFNNFNINNPIEERNEQPNKIIKNQTKDKLSSVIFIGISNVSRKDFESMFLPKLKNALNEFFHKRIKNIILTQGSIQLFIEAQNEDSAKLLLDIIQNFAYSFKGWHFNLGFAYADKYQNLIKSKAFLNIKV